MQAGKNAARVVVIDGKEAVEIELTQGKVALVDLEDWERVRHLRWYTAKVSGGRIYAHATPPKGNSKSTKLQLHNVVLGIKYIDHCDEDGLNNRRANLRPATNASNQQNTGPRGGSSQYKGVSWDKRKEKWRVAFRFQKKDYFVGNYSDEVEAALAYNAAIKPLAGAFARLNDVQEKEKVISSFLGQAVLVELGANQSLE